MNHDEGFVGSVHFMGRAVEYVKTYDVDQCFNNKDLHIDNEDYDFITKCRDSMGDDYDTVSKFLSCKPSDPFITFQEFNCVFEKQQQLIDLKRLYNAIKKEVIQNHLEDLRLSYVKSVN